MGSTCRKLRLLVRAALVLLLAVAAGCSALCRWLQYRDPAKEPRVVQDLPPYGDELRNPRDLCAPTGSQFASPTPQHWPRIRRSVVARSPVGGSGDRMGHQLLFGAASAWRVRSPIHCRPHRRHQLLFNRERLGSRQRSSDASGHDSGG